MNKTIKTAYEMQEAPFERSLPEVEVGDICKLEDIWDGEGDAPEESYSYQLTDTDWNEVLKTLYTLYLEQKGIEAEIEILEEVS